MTSLTFRYIHPETKEVKEVEIGYDEIFDSMEDIAFEKLSECNCQPIGETNVVDCDCYEKYQDFRCSEVF